MNCSTVRVPGSPSAVLNRPSNTIARGAHLPGTGLLVLIAMLIALAVLMVPVGAADTTSDTAITTAHNATVTTGIVVPTVSITTIPTTSLASLFSDDRESINVVGQGVSRTYTPYEEDMATVSRGSDAVLQTHYLSSIKTGNLAGTAWPKFQNNLNNTGTSPYNGPHISNDVWTYTTGDLIRGQPAIGSDGTLYLGSYDKKLYAFNPDGSVKWRYTTGNQIVGSAAIGSDGILYIGSYDTKLYAFNPDGTLNWSYTTGNRIFGSPAIGSDGTVYVGSRDKNLYALNPDGTLKWRYTTGHQIFSSAAIGSDGTIYTGSLDNKLYALNSDGTLKWSYLTGNQIYGSPTIGTDGTIYTGSLDNKLYALNPDGTLKWSYTTGNQIYGSPALGSDGTIYIGSYDNKLYALNPDGTLKWSYTTGNPILGSAVIGADGIIYIGSLDNKLYALNPDGSLKWSYSTGNQIYGSAAIGSDGTLYIGSFDSTLYAFRDAVPVVKFTSSSTGGEAPLSVQFTDLSKGNITARLWDFGDSQTSTEKNPAHTYLTTGSYTVNLTVSNDLGSNSSVQTGYITVGTGIPVGNFTANVTSSTAPPLTVQFTDTTTVNPTAWHWDFGDGVTSAERNPDHTYATAGIYTVNLTVSNSYGSNSCIKTDYITVGSGISVGAFTANTTSGNAPLTVQFTDGSTINPTAWYWDFGDNATSAEQNPVHVYTTSGIYTVNLTVSNSYGSNNCVKTGYITVGSGIPTGSFTANKTSSTAPPLTIQFSDTSTLNPTAWSWDFGDGSSSADRNPVHTYLTIGTFTVNLTASNSYGSNTSSKIGYITVGNGIPVGNFAVNKTSGNAPLTVKFTDTSTISPAAWSWDFGDGSNSTEQNPVHTYVSDGNYTVNLTVSNSFGSNTCVKEGYILVGSGIPVGNFIANKTSGSAPFTIQFTDTTTINPTAWFWDFGDNTTSTVQNPVHTYVSDGNYTVNLTVANSYGSNTSVKEGYILVGSGIPVANFMVPFTTGYAPFVVQFTDTSTINPATWSWDFGDGTTSTEQNPVHTYTSAGNYTVTLIASNGYGSNTLTKTDYIYAGSGYSQNFTFVSSDQPVFQQMVIIHRTEGVAFEESGNGTKIWHVYVGDRCQEDYSDVRFTNTNGLQFAFYLWPTNTSELAQFYVRLEPADQPGTLRVFYGDINVQPVSDAKATGYLIDTFSTLDSDWDTSKLASAAIDSGRLKTTGKTSTFNSYTTYAAKRSITPITGPFSADVDVSYTGTSTSNRGEIYLVAYTPSSYTALGYYDYSSSQYGCFFYYISGTSGDSGLYGSRSAPGSMHLRILRDASNTVMVYENGTLRATGTMDGNITAIGLSNTGQKSSQPGNTAYWDNLTVISYSTTPPGQSGLQPIVNFTANRTGGNVPLTVRFNDTSLYYPTSWNWEFGDGATSTEQNPVHTYASDGNYTVNLTVANSGGSNTLMKNEYITVGSGTPVANFTANRTGDYGSVTVRFIDTSTINPTAWAWDFGDGTSSMEQNPVHTYSSVGYYTVNLTVSNTYGTNTITRENFIRSGQFTHSQNITYFAGDLDMTQQEVIIHRTTGSSFEENKADGTKVWHVQVGDQCRADYGDIRFLDACGTQLAYFLWPDYTADQGRFYVRVEKAYQPGTLQVVYGDSGVLTTSNVNATGAFIDTFSTLDTAWNTKITSYAGLENGKLKTISPYWISGDLSSVITYASVKRNITPIPGAFSAEIDMNYTPQNSGDGSIMLVLHTADTYTAAGYYDTAYGATGGFGGFIKGTLISYTGSGSRGLPGSMHIEITRDAANKVSIYENGTLRATGTMAGDITAIGLANTNPNTNPGLTAYWDNLAIRTYGTTFPAASGLKPVGDFSADRTSGNAPLTILFNDSSYNAPTSWVWDFGDGTTSTDQNPVHTYAADGNYSVNLTVANSYGSNSFAKTGYILVSSGVPVGYFTANKTSGNAPLTIKFTDTTTINPTSWVWDFGDGTTSTDQNPVHTYVADGNYSVNLTVANSYGSNSFVKTGYILVSSGVPVGNFTANKTSGNAPLTVKFTDTSTINPASWVWDFGDNSTSTDQNPVHTYAADGNYTVNLTVANVYGNNSIGKTGYITVSSGVPVANFTANITTGYPSLTVQFTDTSTINPTSWSWDFGDGTTSTEKNPLHIYSTYGTYTVSLTAANGYGSNTQTKSDYIYTGRNEHSQTIGFSAGDPAVYNQIVEIHRTSGTAYQEDTHGLRIWHLYVGDLCRSDYGDVRFTDGSGSQLRFYLQSGYTNSEARFYVRLSNANKAGTLKVLYGDPNLATTSSVNATTGTDDTTGYIYDAFSTLDSDWVTSGVASASISSDQLMTTPNTGTLEYYPTAAVTRQITPVSGAFSADVDLTYMAPSSSPYRGQGELYLVLYNSSATYAAAGYYDNYYGTSTSYNGSFFYYINGTSANSGQATRPASGSMHLRMSRDAANTLSVYENGVLRATGTLPGDITAIGLSNTRYSTRTYYYTAYWDNLVVRVDVATLPSATAFNGKDQTAASPVVSFTGTTIYGLPHTVRFTDTSANYPTAWKWDFGDGSTSPLQNPVHTYAADGNYTVTLTATNEYGSSAVTTSDFTVETMVVTSVTISPSSARINVSETQQFMATLLDQKGNVMTNTSITWSSSDETVGTINANGLFTGLAAGKTNVAASAGGVYSSAAEVSVIGLAPDLKVTSVSSTGYPTTTSVNATIQNAGTADAGAFQTLLSVSGNITMFNVTGLAVGNTITLSLTDVTRHKAGDIIPLNITVDVGNTIPELNEINNEFNTTVTTGAYGDSWMGNRYYNGVDLETIYYAEGHMGVAISNGNTAYGGGNPTYTASDLTIPANATIKVAHLCLAWTWYGYAPYQNVTFNGHEISTPIAHHADNADGQDIYDVTAYFNPNSTNTATIINGPSANYGRTLVVIYEDSSQPYRQIWLDEGYDILYHDPATGYAVFNNVTHGDVASAQLINVLPSGDTGGDGQNILFNGQSNTMVVKKGSDPAFGYYSVTRALQSGTNDMGVSATGSYMSLSTSILTITHVTASEAGFTATPTSGKTPLTVLFTDTSTGTPATWNWDFGDGSTSTEQNPTHTYRTVGNYTINLTVTNSLGSDTESKARYIIAHAPSANDALIPIVGFTAGTTSGTFPLTVQFNDTTTGNVTNWIWDFQNDGTTDSTLQNPAFTYTSAGSYAVNLTVSGPDGSNSTLKSAFITVNLVTGTSLPLTNEKNGTVSGDLYVASFQPVPFVNQPTTGVTSRDFDQPFTIPAFTNIQWAKVYVNVYSGSGSADWPTWTTTTLDSDGDGTYETVLGVENMTTSTYSADGKVYWINDHTNRVYSDYETSYDVTNLITSSHPAVHVKNEKTGTEYDGRLKAVTLVVAYNDGDSDTVKYWVNHGHDWFNAGSSSTTFGTAGIPTGFTDATLNNVALSSADGTYTFNSVSQAGANPVAPINYYENHTWSVTGAVNPAADSVFQYALGTGSSFKTTLAALAVRYPGTQTPSVQVQVVGADGNPLIADRIALEGGTVPLNVTNMSSNRFSAVPAGTYQLTVTKAGHISVNTTIHYAAGSVRELTATLVTHAYQPTVILAENGVSLAGMTHTAPEQLNALRNETDQYNLTLNGGGVVSVALEYPMRFQLNQPQVTSPVPVGTEMRNGTFLWTNPSYTTTNATLVVTAVPASGQSPLGLLLTGGKLGDVYYNGQITSTDSLYILHYIVGDLKSLPTYDYADITRDGKITSTDALYILHYIVGNVNEYYQKV